MHGVVSWPVAETMWEEGGSRGYLAWSPSGNWSMQPVSILRALTQCLEGTHRVQRPPATGFIGSYVLLRAWGYSCDAAVLVPLTSGMNAAKWSLLTVLCVGLLCAVPVSSFKLIGGYLKSKSWVHHGTTD